MVLNDTPGEETLKIPPFLREKVYQVYYKKRFNQKPVLLFEKRVRVRIGLGLG